MGAGYEVVVLQSWTHRFLQQCSSIVWFKTCRVAWRNWPSTLLRLVVIPFLFILLTFIIEKVLNADQARTSFAIDTPSTPASQVSAIPPCETDIYARTPCWDFFYTPNTSSTAQAVVQAMRQNNPGRQIAQERVLGFASREGANVWLLDNPERVLSGVHFNEPLGSQRMSFTIQTNSTTKVFREKYQAPDTFSTLPLQVAVERELARSYFSQAGSTFDPAAWDVWLRGFPHPALDSVSVAAQVLGPFLFATNMFAFVLVLAAVVAEREMKLRQALRTMGMMESSFWASWCIFEIGMAFLTSLLIIAFGAIFQFSLFLNNNFGVLFFTFFLFQLAMSSLAFLVSVFIAKSQVAVNIGFVVFLIGWIMQIVVLFGYPYTPDYVDDIRVVTVLFALCPWTLFVKMVSDLGAAVVGTNPGLVWNERSRYCQNLSVSQRSAQPYNPNVYRDYNCVLSVDQGFVFLALEWAVYLLLAIYLDNVIPNEYGVRKRPWFFLLPGYWWPVGRRNLRHRLDSVATGAAGSQFLRPTIPLPENAEGVPAEEEDVAQERQQVQDLLEHRRGGGAGLAAAVDPHAVEVFGLQKLFPGRSLLMRLLCCGRRSKSEFWAIKGAWFSIPNGQLFCLLGPNGAGKTTIINCLTGVIPASGGDALIYGQGLSAPGGMERIRAMMGVCPQFDILWSELTAWEHMMLFGNMKGLPRRSIAEQAEGLLDSVKLYSAQRIRSGSYSGGMKRRLSVALALLGNPRIVYLDEPTTGMDPISRRQVWELIEAAKKDRVIVVTTHSMEEADVLADRIAIMARGRLRCIGSSLRLKQRFGTGYQLVAALAADGVEAGPEASQLVKEFIKEALQLEPSDETKTYITWKIPRSKEAELADVLSQLEKRKNKFGVADLQMSLASLEEVFLTIAKRAEIEEAGDRTASFYLDDGTEVKVPLGQETVVHAPSGREFAVTWAQDESGNLQLLGWKEVLATQSADGENKASAVPTSGGVEPGISERQQ